MGADESSSSADAFGLGFDGVVSPWPRRCEQQQTRRLRCHFSGGLAPRPEPWWLLQHDDALVVGWRDYAEYRIDAFALSIEVSLGDVEPAEATLGLLLSALPLALPLFDLEPLHASAVSVREVGAVVLLGASGAGKSTLGAKLASLGADFLSDDATAINDAGNVVPGPPVANPRFLDADQPTIGSYNGKVVRLIRQTEPGAQPPAAVIALSPTAGSPLEIERLSAPSVFEEVLGNVRIPWVFSDRRQARQLAVAASLGRLPGARLRFDPSNEDVSATAEAVYEWAQRL